MPLTSRLLLIVLACTLALAPPALASAGTAPVASARASAEVGTGVLEPPAGGTAFRVFHVPPDAQMREAMSHSTIDGIEADGFHTTQTIDYVMVLEGEVSLELDTGEVTLGPGDCVVQRGTRHAWKNKSDRPAFMCYVQIGAVRV